MRNLERLDIDEARNEANLVKATAERGRQMRWKESAMKPIAEKYGIRVNLKEDPFSSKELDIALNAVEEIRAMAEAEPITQKLLFAMDRAFVGVSAELIGLTMTAVFRNKKAL